MNEHQIWRGVQFRVHHESRGFTRWSSEGEDSVTKRPVWKAVQYRAGDTWFARMRVNGFRVSGEGPNARLALDECRMKALDLQSTLKQVLK